MLVRLPGTRRLIRVQDRRIPAEQLGAVLEFAELERVLADRRGEIRRHLRVTERALTERMRARVAARAAIGAAADAVSLSRFVPQLATFVADAVRALAGTGTTGLWQANAAIVLSEQIDSVTAVEVVVRPEAVESVEAALSADLTTRGLARRFVVVPDVALGEGRCLVRCGERRWIVDLEAWLQALVVRASELLDEMVERMPAEEAGTP